MDDKLINMIVKGIPPHEFVEWYKLVQEKTERDKGWFDQHAVLFNPSIQTTRLWPILQRNTKSIYKLNN